ncbi:MAG TPA: alpha/beta fold hydrolase [Mycobacteriales bacterium]|nr:alpha/beta fold hydrolase [Mycobacteriales bacterium]
MRGRRLAVAVAFGTAAALGGALAIGPVSVGAVGTGHAPIGGLGRFAHQTIRWNDCSALADSEVRASLRAAGAQCGELAVPLDYAHPDGASITVALSRVKASDPAHRRGVLMLNPGGPGDPAMGLAAGVADGLPEIAARYDLIGMDPRFVGASTPLTCRWPTGFALRSAGPDRRTFGQSVSFARELAAGCVRGNENLLPYASTRNTARDMDLVRAALGEPKLSYLGWSYGTYLGAVYTQLFGQRVDRFVLDSAVDPDVYAAGIFPSMGPATEAALRNWAGWAAARDATYHLGASADAVLSTVDGIGRAAQRAPLRVGQFRVDTHVLPVLLFIPIRIDGDESYAGIAEDVAALKAAAGGATVSPTAGLAANLAAVYGGSSATAGRGVSSVIFCADAPASHDPEVYYRDIQARRADEPRFGPLTRNITPCAFWPTSPVEPPTRVHNGVPALIVGSTGDPRATYPGQLALHRDMTGSRLVTLAGAFLHLVYGIEDNSCITDTVNRYLLDGVLPAADVTCHRAPTSAAPAGRAPAGGAPAGGAPAGGVAGG